MPSISATIKYMVFASFGNKAGNGWLLCCCQITFQLDECSVLPLNHLLDPFLGKVFNLTQMKNEDPLAEIYLQLS